MGDTRIDQLVKRWGSCDKLNDSESEQLIGLLLAERDSLQSRLSEARAQIARLSDHHLKTVAALDLINTTLSTDSFSSINELNAQAVEALAKEFIEDAWPDCKGKYHWMIGYAARLRQQGKDND